MKQRIITGIGLLFLVGILYFWGDNYYIFQIGLSILGVIGMSELFSIVQNDKRFRSNDAWLTGTAYVITGLLPWVSIFWLARLLILIAVIVLFLCFILSKSNSVERLSYISLILSILGPALMAMSYFYTVDKYYIAFLMFVAFGSDTFAYFVGSFIGKHQLIAWVSPKKTIEGAIGGLLGAVLAVFLLQSLYVHFVTTAIPPEVDIFVQTPLKIMLIFVLAAFSQCGDLFFSKIKRYFVTKDYGNIFPGHGGVIDRNDSLIFVTVIFSLFYFLVN